jgi:hypothetical protein
MSALPDPSTEPVVTVERAGALAGLNRSAAYAAAGRYLATGGAEGLPTIRLNAKTLRCPTALVLELLGLSTHTNDTHVHDPASLRE